MIRQEINKLCGLDGAVQTLAGIYCAASVSEQEIKAWFSSVDLEALPQEVSCMAAAAAASAGFAGTPQVLIPRLRGITKYVHVLNMGMMLGVCTLGEALNSAGIPVLLLEDTALYMTYPDAPQRHLWQMRIGVRQQDYTRTLETARDAGFRVEVLKAAATARRGASQQITIIPVKDTSRLWDGTQKRKKGNAVFLCPEPGAIFIAVSQGGFRALTTPQPSAAIVRWMMDMKLLLDQLSSEEWIRAAQIAGKEHACSHIRLMLTVYAALSGSAAAVQRKELFHGGGSDARLLKRLTQLRALPEKGCRIRRLYLRCRLRRPDSIWGTARLFLREVFRKLGN